MASISNGILGTVSGRIGPVTSYMRNGRNIIRTASNKGVVKNTTARLAQREKIAICNTFTGAFTGTGFFNITFPAYGHSGTGYNRATGSLMNLAITGNYPGQSLAWPKVLIARGPLPCAENVTVAMAGGSNCAFTWTDNSNEGTARASDKVILCAYSISAGKSIFSLNAGTRKTGDAVLDISKLENGPVVTWLTFINDKGDVADSVFAGIV